MLDAGKGQQTNDRQRSRLRRRARESGKGVAGAREVLQCWLTAGKLGVVGWKKEDLTGDLGRTEGGMIEAQHKTRTATRNPALGERGQQMVFRRG